MSKLIRFKIVKASLVGMFALLPIDRAWNSYAHYITPKELDFLKNAKESKEVGIQTIQDSFLDIPIEQFN